MEASGKKSSVTLVYLILGILYKFSLKPGHSIEVKGLIPEGCIQFAINLGTDEKNYVLHFNPRFDYSQDKKIIILNSMVDDVFGEEQRESCFPFQEGSDTTVCFQFEQDKIIIELPTGNPLSFPVRFPIEEISYLSLRNLQLKSITLK
ncbi:galectin-1-like [Aquarana catesbeiana]|uniref:galectin-1-like n=1 Tax=Aquarana catesbeiana TaxID=8400 RepID=UPI003CC97E3D